MINGSETYSFKNPNQKIKPPFVDPDKPTITIMWTSTTPFSSNQSVAKIELPEVTDDCKDVSNTTANPIVIKDNHIQVSKSVRKADHQTSPGVQHSDCEKAKATNTGTVEAVRKGSQMSLSGVQHIDCDREDELCEPFRREVDDVNNDDVNNDE